MPDAVFVESGDAVFTHNALKLMASALNFSHCEHSAESHQTKTTTTTTTATTTTATRVKTRDWYVDPYLSDHDLRRLVRLFPGAHRLEGKPTGSKLRTTFERTNVHGQRDEKARFFSRWCVVL